MQSQPAERTSFSCPPALKDELDDLADAWDTSRSDVIRTLLSETVDHHQADDDGNYYPDDPTLREVYVAAVEHVNGDAHILRWDTWGSAIATDTGIAKSTLEEGQMHDLERHGFVRRLEGGPMDRRPRKVYRVKPLCADPSQWVYRRVQ